MSLSLLVTCQLRCPQLKQRFRHTAQTELCVTLCRHPDRDRMSGVDCRDGTSAFCVRNEGSSHHRRAARRRQTGLAAGQ